MAGVFRFCHPTSFYRYSVSRSPYRTVSWFKTWSQFRYLCVHFFATFWLARNSIFSSDVSFGNTLFVLVTFRYWRFSPSIMFMDAVHKDKGVYRIQWAGLPLFDLWKNLVCDFTDHFSGQLNPIQVIQLVMDVPLG